MSINAVISPAKVMTPRALAFRGNVSRPDPGALGKTNLQHASPSAVDRGTSRIMLNALPRNAQPETEVRSYSSTRYAGRCFIGPTA